eukprot:2287200-Amphidinium_carterae.2
MAHSAHITHIAMMLRCISLHLRRRSDTLRNHRVVLLTIANRLDSGHSRGFVVACRTEARALTATSVCNSSSSNLTL